MDQLFVNERLPSPPSSVHSEDESANGHHAEGTSTQESTRWQGKQPVPLPEIDLDGAEIPEEGTAAYGLHGQRHSSGGHPERSTSLRSSQHSTEEASQHEVEDETLLGHDNTEDISRPSLGGRQSTEERSQTKQLTSEIHGLFGGSTSTHHGHEFDTTSDRDDSHRSPLSRSPDHGPDSSRPHVPRRYSRPSRPYSYAGGMPASDILVSRAASRHHSVHNPGHVHDRRPSSPEVVVPRWQPDAEVTFCPICKTQFSFFVRKHHCRKCGRVVCNACSPHRITIPHQYIVQPPTDPTASTSRPSVDAGRTRSSIIVESLGGGERVRLCNPCVPDPNIAPPQTRSDGQPVQGHSRSQSMVPFSPARRDLDIPDYRSRQRESSITSESARNRYWAATPQPGLQPPTSSSYSQRGDALLRPDALEARSRSSTVGSSREGNQGGNNHPRTESSATYSRPYHALSPRSEAMLSRPLPNVPQPQRHAPRRRQIPEEDQCWLCFRELPSRDLPNFEELRSAHVLACLETATQRASGSPSRTTTSTPVPPPPSPPPQSTHPPQRLGFGLGALSLAGSPSSSASSPAVPTLSSRAAQPQPPPAGSTPESRMLARERQHAAIVLGQASSSSSPGPSSLSAMSRVIPYIASEKDGIDDAECMICMEEFEVGQEMGRLECFCRFHLACIRGWFERKAGKCPVHGGDFF